MTPFDVPAITILAGILGPVAVAFALFLRGDDRRAAESLSASMIAGGCMLATLLLLLLLTVLAALAG